MGLATITDAVAQQPLMPYYKIEIDKFYEHFRIVPAHNDKVPDNLKKNDKDVEKTVIKGIEVLIFHRERSVRVNNYIPVDLKTIIIIIRECKKKFGIDEEYGIRIN